MNGAERASDLNTWAHLPTRPLPEGKVTNLRPENAESLWATATLMELTGQSSTDRHGNQLKLWSYITKSYFTQRCDSCCENSFIWNLSFICKHQISQSGSAATSSFHSSRSTDQVIDWCFILKCQKHPKIFHWILMCEELEPADSSIVIKWLKN